MVGNVISMEDGVARGKIQNEAVLVVAGHGMDCGARAAVAVIMVEAVAISVPLGWGVEAVGPITPG